MYHFHLLRTLVEDGVHSFAHGSHRPPSITLSVGKKKQPNKRATVTHDRHKMSTSLDKIFASVSAPTTFADRILAMVDAKKIRMLIVRGMPGAGKTHLCNEIRKRRPTAVVMSSDEYFTATNGTYVFKATKLEQAHHECQRRVQQKLKGDEDALVIVDNTLARRGHAMHYIRLCDSAAQLIVNLVPRSMEETKHCATRSPHSNMAHAMQVASQFEVFDCKQSLHFGPSFAGASTHT